MTTLIVVVSMTTLLLLAFYAVPVRRTHRKEQGLPLERPGPETESRSEVAELV